MQSISETIRQLPRSPGVYLFKNRGGEVVYVGKAANLRERVRSYFGAKGRPLDLARGDRMGRPIEDMTHEIASVATMKTPTAIEALILEAALIKKHWPRYNVRDKDQKSFLYVVIIKEKYPRVDLVRGEELGRSSSVILSEVPRSGAKSKDLPFAAIFGPFPHASAIRAALKIIRRIFPYSLCRPPLLVPPLNKGRKVGGRPCFNYHLALCPGVCIGAVTPQEYKKTIRTIILFFEGKKARIIRELKRDMVRASRDELFESAAKIRNQIRALEHIRDVAVLTADRIPQTVYRSGQLFAEGGQPINILGRLEGYDISNIGGKHAVGSMVVFENGEPKKSEYRLFKIKTVKGANDVAMMKEVLRRRLMHSTLSSRPTPTAVGGVERSPLGAAKGRSLPSAIAQGRMARDDKKKWLLPQLILVDGGLPQVNAAREVVRQFSLSGRSSAPISSPARGEVRWGGRIPIVGIAKGPDRKRDEFIITGDLATKEELGRITRLYPHILKHLRDEAHRFAQSYYRRRHGKTIADLRRPHADSRGRVPSPLGGLPAVLQVPQNRMACATNQEAGRGRG